jgi:hypothetical protein
MFLTYSNFERVISVYTRSDFPRTYVLTTEIRSVKSHILYVLYSRVNYTDVTCQWSIGPFVRDFVVDRQSGFLGNGT